MIFVVSRYFRLIILKFNELLINLIQYYRPAPTLRVRGLCDDSILDRHYVLEIDQDGSPVLIGRCTYLERLSSPQTV